MRIQLLLPLATVCLACNLAAQTNLPSLIIEHADIRVNYTAVGTNNLNLVIRDEDHALDYQTNQIVLLALEITRLTLPPGTPFGNAGDPLWVLPQARSPGQAVLFLGIAGGAAGVFDGPLTMRLKNVRGPGQFFVWQSDEVGGLQIKMNSADGFDASDKVEVLSPGHDHYNWGFTTGGVYCVTLQASGTRIGEADPISSPEATFVFHVLPLGVVTPFTLWQKAHWLQGTDGTINGPAADPDNDGLVNALEYASNLSPNIFSTNGRPAFSFVAQAPDTFGAFTFTRVKAATDLNYQLSARNLSNSGAWETLTNLVSLSDHGATETVTVRDFVPTAAVPARFYQFRVGLSHP